mmetsp:Transcript_90608/g.194282  ORF Transcript_90608/g.194282 Transcript_90608/m.194282 type:complete len:209 (+) Transcript_90608:94-720(+)
MRQWRRSTLPQGLDRPCQYSCQAADRPMQCIRSDLSAEATRYPAEDLLHLDVRHAHSVRKARQVCAEFEDVFGSVSSPRDVAGAGPLRARLHHQAPVWALDDHMRVHKEQRRGDQQHGAVAGVAECRPNMHDLRAVRWQTRERLELVRDDERNAVQTPHNLRHFSASHYHLEMQSRRIPLRCRSSSGDSSLTGYPRQQPVHDVAPSQE